MKTTQTAAQLQQLIRHPREMLTTRVNSRLMIAKLPSTVYRETETLFTSTRACIHRMGSFCSALSLTCRSAFFRSFAAVGGFKQPILHGLCSFGIAGKAAYDKFGPFKDIKVRFAGHLFPGETLITSFWKDGDKVLFVSRCKERGTMVLSNAAVTLAK